MGYNTWLWVIGFRLSVSNALLFESFSRGKGNLTYNQQPTTRYYNPKPTTIRQRFFLSFPSLYKNVISVIFIKPLGGKIRDGNQGQRPCLFLSRIKETCPQNPLTNGKEFPWACEKIRNFPLVDKYWVSEQETQARKGGLKAQLAHSPGQSAAAPWVFYEGYEHSPPCKVGCSKSASDTRQIF